MMGTEYIGVKIYARQLEDDGDAVNAKDVGEGYESRNRDLVDTCLLGRVGGPIEHMIDVTLSSYCSNYNRHHDNL